MITVGVNLQEILIDPYTNGNFQQMTIADLIFEPLIYIDENLNTIGGIAQSWEINSIGDRYRFKIKRDILFHDGSKLSADDIVWSLRKHISENSNSYQREILREILFKNKNSFNDSIIKIDDYTVEFHLKGPYPPFLENLASIYITPKNYNANKPIGCGPFEVKKLTRTEVELLRSKSIGLIKSNIQKLKFQITQTNEFADKLKNKELDFTLQAPLDLALNPPKDYSVFTSEFDLVSVVFYFNFHREIYSRPEVRIYVRERLYNARSKVGFLSKFDKLIDHLVPLGMMPPEYYNKRPLTNTKRPNLFPKRLRILTPNTFLTASAMDLIKSEFGKDEVEIDFFLGKGKQLHEQALKGDFDLALLPYEGMVRDPDAFMFLITPTAPVVNFFKLPTEKEISELNKIKFEKDKEKRLQGYGSIIRNIEERDILIPIFGQNMPFLYSNKIIPPKSHLMTLISLRFFNVKE